MNLKLNEEEKKQVILSLIDSIGIYEIDMNFHNDIDFHDYCSYKIDLCEKILSKLREG